MSLGRRDFITLLGSAAAALPVAARAQQPARIRRIGVMMGTGNNALGQARAKALREELEKSGWTEGRTVTIEWRWAEGRIDRYSEIAAEFVRLQVDVIVTGGTPPTAAAKQATSTIPIVFTGTGDPVGTGLVSSLARPGGNVTGLSNQTKDLAGKRVELLRELVPGLRGLGILINADNVSAMLEMREVEDAARMIGLECVALKFRRPEDIALELEAFKGPARALYVVLDTLANANALRINTLALGARLPTVHGTREQLEAGGLMSYGVDTGELYRRAADYVDKILRGAKPGDLPVEQPTKFELVINLTTARALGLTVPDSLLAIANAVIE
jgi:putative tryptophan/tyrosine transport system substrate-binding protein